MNRPTRIVFGALTVLTAVVIFLVLGPRTESSVESIEMLAELNANSAESAPQQGVVNGWETNDLLRLLAEQQDGLLTQQNLLLVVILIVLGIGIMTGVDGCHAPSRTPAVEPSPGHGLGRSPWP